MPLAPEQKVQTMEPLPYPYWSFDCLHLVQATIPAKWILHQPVQKTAF